MKTKQEKQVKVNIQLDVEINKKYRRHIKTLQS